MRRAIWMGTFAGACAALFLASTAAASAKAKPRISVETVRQVIEKKPDSVQLVTFPDTEWNAVKIVRGNGSRPPGEKTETAEIIRFADPRAGAVRVMRGEGEHSPAAPAQPRSAKGMTVQLVTFADFRDRPVSILRGSMPQAAVAELFGPASAADLDRVAFAVDGAESSHGADLRMWRDEPSGPQGPMQVTAAAASDVGGGDRFDLAANRILGRAYLARMYRRYGNWPDAVAAYNWGPANLDAWISAGRVADKFPLVVERYRDRVLRAAVVGGTAER